MKKRIIVVGDVGVKLYLGCKNLPYSNETVVGTTYSYSPDTKAAAASIAFTRFGVDATLAACVGDDANGAKMISILSGYGVDTRFIKKSKDAATALSVFIDETEAGDRTIFYPGASAQHSPEDTDEAFNCYPDGVLLRLDAPAEALKMATRLAGERTLPIYISAVGLSTFDNSLLPEDADIFVADTQSAAAITGIAPLNIDSALRCAIELSHIMNVRNVAFRMSNGYFYVYDGKYSKVLKYVSRGKSFADVFAPAIIAEFIRCEDIFRASQFAVHAVKLWDDASESLYKIPSQSEIRDDESEI